MAYTAYSNAQVFQDPILNTLADRLINYCSNAPFSVNQMALSGNAARMISGDLSIDGIRAVIFITADKSLFNSLISELSNIWPKAAITKFSDRFQISYSGRFIEIWFSTIAINTTNIDNIIVQDSNEIPANLL